MSSVLSSPLCRMAVGLVCGVAVVLSSGCAQLGAALGVNLGGDTTNAAKPSAAKAAAAKADVEDQALVETLSRAGLYPSWVGPQVIRLDMPSNAAFATGAVEFPAVMRSTLQTVAAQMKSPLLQDWQLLVVGHADDRGSDADNLVMSRARAAAVLHYIEGQGIAVARLASDGRGEREPLATNAQRYGRELNRRVELFLSRGPLPPGATAPQ